jgi:hypothetical protein
MIIMVSNSGVLNFSIEMHPEPEAAHQTLGLLFPKSSVEETLALMHTGPEAAQ